MLKDSASYASSKTIDEFYHAGNMLRNKRQGKSKIESIVKLSVVHPKCRKQTDGMKLKRRRVIMAADKERTKTCLEINSIRTARPGKYPFDTSHGTFRNVFS